MLEPSEVSEAGYRLYGKVELEKLQQILFYRELDFSLEDILNLLGEKDSRLSILVEQKVLLQKKRERITHVLDTINETIYFEGK